jgi:cellulose synthase/poly-beta-1,6-N-acetylglucosamine synthase-like glycosyltransferase
MILLIIYRVMRLMGRRLPVTPYHAIQKDYQFGIMITAHRDVDHIPPIVDSLLKQTHSRFNIYVVADNCDTSRLVFHDTRVHILKTPTPFNDQLKSLDYGWRHFSENDEVLVIFDPDNLVHPGFLRSLNAWYNAGYRAVCASMRSKNRDSVYSRIDCWGATLSDFLERDMRSILGLSSNITGSGISVHRDIYSLIRYDRRSKTGGFDKQLQMGAVKNTHRIAYAHDAMFYDEKVGDGHNFERQRIRWIAAHFKFLGNAFHLLGTGFRRWDFNLIYFGYNLIRPPYIILLGLSFSVMVADWFIQPWLSVAWAACFALFTLSFLLIVTRDRGSFKEALSYVPRILYRQARALLSLKLNKGSLLKTAHTQVLYIDDILDPAPFLTATTCASRFPPAPLSMTQSPPQEYASSPRGQAKDKKQDYARSR